ncbi:MAG: hypothetical protein WKI04_13190 [Ferruginibacter sp.]
MKQYLIILAGVLILSSCGSSKKEGSAELNDKKANLQKLKGERTKLDNDIITLEGEIGKIDTSAGAAQKTKLVAVQKLEMAEFSHFIELQGHIDAENVSYITPRGGLGSGKGHLCKTRRPR